jgi:hypothetical protein
MIILSISRGQFIGSSIENVLFILGGAYTLWIGRGSSDVMSCPGEFQKQMQRRNSKGSARSGDTYSSRLRLFTSFSISQPNQGDAANRWPAYINAGR